MAKRKLISICEKENNTNAGQVIWNLFTEEESSVDTSSSEYLQENDTLNQLSPRLSPIITARTKIHSCNNNSTNDIVHCGFESPDIKLRSIDLLYSISPELTQQIVIPRQRTPEKSYSPPNLPISPIIQKGHIRLRKNRIARPKLEEPSPELFVKQPVVVENDSISSHQQLVIESVERTSFESPIDKGNNLKERRALLYYQPPKRKKTYKKGGLADRLQKIIKFKKSRVKIWHHEKYKNIDSPLDNAEEIIQFKFRNSWTEYGVVLMECDVCKVGNNEEDEPCILNLGFDQILNLKFNDVDIYELYPPYSKDIIMHKGKNIKYYFNVSKIIKLLLGK